MWWGRVRSAAVIRCSRMASDITRITRLGGAARSSAPRPPAASGEACRRLGQKPAMVRERRGRRGDIAPQNTFMVVEEIMEQLTEQLGGAKPTCCCSSTQHAPRALDGKDLADLLREPW